MKHILFIVLLVAMLITAGCVNSGSTTDIPMVTANTTVTTILPTVPTIITTLLPTPVPQIFLDGGIGTCFSEPRNRVYQLCLDQDVNVSIKNNRIFASGTLFYDKLLRQIGLGEDLDYEQDEVSASVNLKIYNNKSIKVAEVSKAFTIDKNGKTLVDLTTDISDNNPIGWTYRVSVEKNTDAVASVTTNPTLRPQTGSDCSVKYSFYRYGTKWFVDGIVTNDGDSGKCEVNADLMGTNGIEIDQRSQILTLSSGDSQSFSMDFVDTTNRGLSIKVSISNKK
jgi:hypothetical protein